MTEDRDEREFKASVELHTPKFVPGVKAELSFRRLWDKRLERYGEKTSEVAGASRQELQARLADADEFADVFEKGARFCASSGSAEFSDFVVKLVAAAFNDDAKVNETDFLLRKMESFQPVHLRVLLTEDMRSKLTPEAELMFNAYESANCSIELYQAVAAELHSFGFLHEGLEGLSGLGRALMDLVDRIDREID